MKRGLIFALGWMVVACDVVKPPYKESGNPPDNVAQDTVTRAIIEKFTGFMCGNCPAAGRTAHAVAAAYPGKVFVAEIHTGILADTFPPFGAYYYKTPAGDSLNQYYGIDNRGVPIGLVGRRNWGGDPLSTASTWGAKVDSLLKEPPLCLMSVTTAFNADTREVVAAVSARFLRAQSEPLNLVVYVLEDSVVGYQKDYSQSPSSVYDYVQRDMLRACPTGIWGRNFVNSAAPGDNKTLNVAFRLNSGWKANQCKILAFLTRAAHRDILQAAESYVISR
jgi:hypothetical protein